MLIELREYTVLPGKRDEWVKMMEEEIIPFQVQNGIAVLGSFVVEDQPDKYVWIRRFASEEERVKKYEAVYESDHWKTNLLPKVVTLVDREKHRITRLNATALSAIQ